MLASAHAATSSAASFTNSTPSSDHAIVCAEPSFHASDVTSNPWCAYDSAFLATIAVVFSTAFCVFFAKSFAAFTAAF